MDRQIKEYTDTLPQHLLQNLRNANIKDTESESIKTKLQERTSCSIISLPATSTHQAAKDMCCRQRFLKQYACVYYCSTYYKAVREGGGGGMEDMCYERLRAKAGVN
jgi:hypothetical protein